MISQAAAGRSASIAVEGPRGSGKSALLDELARRTLPARTIRLNCRPIERPFPLRSATRLAEVLNCAAGPPIAALAPRDPTELFERLVDLIATSAPVVVLVDDVHFADEASATIIDALTSTGGASGCTVIATGPLALCALDRASQLHLELGPLTEEALNELGLPNGVWLTGGHPAIAAACVQSIQ